MFENASFIFIIIGLAEINAYNPMCWLSCCGRVFFGNHLRKGDFSYLFSLCFRWKVLIIHISVYVFIRSWLWAERVKETWFVVLIFVNANPYDDTDNLFNDHRRLQTEEMKILNLTSALISLQLFATDVRWKRKGGIAANFIASKKGKHLR